MHVLGARAVWDDWSKTSGKFDAADQDRVWASFRGERKEGVITVATIYGWAKERGWVSSINAQVPAADTRVEATAKALAIFRDRAFNPANWEGEKAPPRKWIVPNYIPDGTVTLLYADGGTGKSYLKLQLAVARATAREWIGLIPEPGRTLVLSTEDDLDEMWRRLEGMLPFFNANGRSR